MPDSKYPEQQIDQQLRQQNDCEFDKKGRQLLDIGHDGAWSNSSTSFSSKNGFTTAITTIDGKSQIINAGTRSKGQFIVCITSSYFTPKISIFFCYVCFARIQPRK